MALFIGCPVWQHPDWQFQKHSDESKLASYAQFFGTVEGNTTFYSLPKAEVAQAWQKVAEQGFRFSFKFPKPVTHEGKWTSCPEFEQFLGLLEGFSSLGPVQIQLPGSFDFPRLGELARFFGQLPSQHQYAVEVRNLDFFDKQEKERSFNRLLMDHGVGRTVFDTRPLFQMPPDSPAIIDGHMKKPKMPLHVIATADFILVRFIGYGELDKNQRWFKPWIAKIQQWLAEGKDVYLFAHTPDNVQAPELGLDMQKALLDLQEGAEQLARVQPQNSLF